MVNKSLQTKRKNNSFRLTHMKTHSFRSFYTATLLTLIFTLTACDLGTPRGIPQRLSNTTCVAPDVRGALGMLDKEVAFDQYGLFLPLSLIPHPSDPDRWLVAEKGGLIKTFSTNDGEATTALDLTATVSPLDIGEGGLLDITLDPDFDNNGYLYVSYTSGAGDISSRIERYTSSDNGITFALESVKEILTLEQPYTNHNGGSIAFGPDGYLYIGFGDGGSANDPLGAGQDTSTLLGAMLRIDVNTSAAYEIPSTNPFANSTGCDDQGCPEIFAYGLRNPWQWNFDSETGELWAGDVGQNAREEINVIELGGNYGWDIKEGFACHEGDCSTPNLTDPIIDYPHSDGNSVTGGFVYRGSELIGLAGTYIFGDFGSGQIWGLTFDVENNPVRLDLENVPNVAAFAQGHDNELYAISIATSTIYKLTQGEAQGDTTVPTLLSETGCFQTEAPQSPIKALIPYNVQQPLWSDGAVKDRFIGLPNGSKIDIDETNDWLFPIGTVLMKNFKLNDVLFETRLLMRHAEGDWAGYSYEWNSEGTDATLIPDGKTTTVQDQTWTYPSSSQCNTCHTAVTNHVLGLETQQLNHAITYSNGVRANQLTTLNRISLFTDGLPAPVAELPKLPAPLDLEASVESKVKGYLHSNCANCHQPNGTTPTNLDFRFTTALADMNICDTLPLDDMDIAEARVVAPGDPDKSVLLQKMLLRGEGQMPPLGSDLVDTVGTELVRTWIQELTSCSP